MICIISYQDILNNFYLTQYNIYSKYFTKVYMFYKIS
jgi:hypothetical protein